MRTVCLNLDIGEATALANALATTLAACECGGGRGSERCGTCRTLVPILADLTRMDRRPRMRRPVTMPYAQPTRPVVPCKVVPFRGGDGDIGDSSVAVSTRR